MSLLIHTTFDSIADAQAAQRYLREQGFGTVHMTDHQIRLETNEINWIAAYEILHSLGGHIEQDLAKAEHVYGISNTVNDDSPIPDEKMDTHLIDPQTIIDTNIGYGDYELIEPYILHRYVKLVDEDDKDPS